ncbi:MAG: FAD-binding oxidoreductase [Magnetococcales bacterium]|nr:FAD-binding oxidoreductase [Magnetococcales bacterium]
MSERVHTLWWSDRALLPEDDAARPLIPYGNGRSGGDCCVAPGGGTRLDTRGLDRLRHFDPVRGRVACEAGTRLGDLLDFLVPRGWMLPVLPGSRRVTVGGAVAGDVHGANHPTAGGFGAWVRHLELLRGDGRRWFCSAFENPDLFRATVGGLGLTGVIVWVELELKAVRGPFLTRETVACSDLADALRLIRAGGERWEYLQAHVDVTVRGRRLGRGLVSRGQHAGPGRHPPPPWETQRQVTITPQVNLMRPWVGRLYHRLHHRPQPAGSVHYRAFFFAADCWENWTRLYGPDGLLHYHGLVPEDQAVAGLGEILDRLAASGLAAAPGRLRRFGPNRTGGLLSFARPGFGLAVDLPNRGRATLDLLGELDRVVVAAGGTVEPGRDRRLDPAAFAAFFPQWDAMQPYRDPAFASAFWRRVAGGIS